MRLPCSGIQDKTLEIERKYRLKRKNWDSFVQSVRRFDPDKELVTKGPDTYYRNEDGVVLRWRHGPDISQLTIKSRYSLSSSMIRQELEIDLNDNTIKDTIRFIKSLGFKKLFRIHKKCHIFWITNTIGEACIVAYGVSCKGYKDKYFIEIEAKKGMSVHDSKKLIRFWEKKLKISQNRRLNDTLFEIYSGQKTRLVDKSERVLCFKCGTKKSRSQFDAAWLKKTGSKCRKCRSKEMSSPEGRERSRKYSSKKRSSDPDFKIKTYLRNRINHVVLGKDRQKAGSAVRDLGCTSAQFVKYLESLFYADPSTGNPMSWSNRGWGPGKWQIDHIKPLGLFDLSNREEFLAACHYTNMQPLWWEDHMSKTKEDVLLIKSNNS